MSSLFDRHRQQRRRAKPQRQRATSPDAPYTIARLSHDGRGVTRDPAGKTVFVTDALPGEQVDLAVHRERGRFNEAHVKHWHRYAPVRQQPACAHFQQCGGCQLQHLAPSAELAHKETVLLEQLQHFGGLTTLPPLAPALCGPELGYRRKARLGVKQRQNGELILGFREAGSKHLTPITQCPVLVPELRQLLDPLHQHLSTLEQGAHIGHIELLQVTRAEQPQVVLTLRLLKPLTSHDHQRWAHFSTSQNCLILLADGQQRQPLDGGTMPELTDASTGMALGCQASDFIQVNPTVNQHMVSRAMRWLDTGAHRRVLDLFCGFGNFSFAAARLGAEVMGLEGSASLVTQARQNAHSLGLQTTRFQVHDLTQPWPEAAQGPWDSVILDPPRAGAAQVVRELVRQPVPKVLYVSCNPATLGRDIGQLVAGGYQLAQICLIDMFPQTRHVEAMALLTGPEG